MNNFSGVVRKKFLDAVNRFGMLNSANEVIIGFSGGADSVCLLNLFNECSGSFGVDIVAVHVNHGIRGEEAAEDEAFSEAFAAERGIRFISRKIDCISEAEASGESLEECARRLRYDIFNEVSASNSVIATAHNANDNAETVLFNLARGASLKGVCGIPPLRDNIIRPLIFCTREEIEGYCRENDLEFVTDSTNLSDDYSRNKIRHLVLPVLKEINSGFFDNVTRFSASVSLINEHFLAECRKEYERALFKKALSLDHLKTLDEAVCKEVIKLYNSENYCLALDSLKINNLYLLVSQGGRLQISGDFYAEAVKSEFRIFKYEKSDELFYEMIEGYPFSFSNLKYSVFVDKYVNNSKKVNRIVLDNLIDCDKIEGNLILRSRRAGDEFVIPKRMVTKSLKKLFNESAIPIENRDYIPVLCDDIGIIWIYGFGVVERVRADDNSSDIILIGGKTND